MIRFILTALFLLMRQQICVATRLLDSNQTLEQRLACAVGGFESHDVSNLSPQPDPVGPDFFTVTFETTAAQSPIVIEVNRSWSPFGADRFYQLVLDEYYTCAAFFRVVPDFVVQFGIAAEPAESSKWDTFIPDDTYDDDTKSNKQSNLEGYVSFATSGENSRTTQVFININNNARLDSMGFTPFAVVVKGLDTVKAIYNPTPDDSGGADQDSYKVLGNIWIFKTYPDIDYIISTMGYQPRGSGEPLQGLGTSSENDLIKQVTVSQISSYFQWFVSALLALVWVTNRS